MEGLPRRREYLEIFFGSHTSLENGQHLSQGPPGEANNDISTPGLRFAYGQANNPAPRKARIRTTNRTH